MNYATVVPELFSRFPKLEATYRAGFAYMGDEEPGQYIVFGSRNGSDAYRDTRDLH